MPFHPIHSIHPISFYLFRAPEEWTASVMGRLDQVVRRETARLNK